MKTRLYLIIAVAVVLSSFVFLSLSSGKIHQPLRYNHLKHVDEAELECADCHQYVEEREFAGIPNINECAECHSDLLGETEEEKKLQTYIEADSLIHWKRIFKLPKHVFFSHRRHVSMAEIECAECHGEIQNLTEPPQPANNRITMSFCMDCHSKQEVDNDCLACHR
jgi:Zn finger protein HypA/HybF involved in hydrogenase expression